MNLFNKVERFKTLIEEEVSDCKVLGHPVACGVAFKFTGKMADCDYAIGEALHEVGGWEVSRMQFPSCLAFQASQQWIDEIDQLVADIAAAQQLVLRHPDKYTKSGMAGVYGTAATFPDRGLIAEAVISYLDVVMTPESGDANVHH